jgi:hypothetical protein
MDADLRVVRRCALATTATHVCACPGSHPLPDTFVCPFRVRRSKTKVHYSALYDRRQYGAG